MKLLCFTVSLVAAFTVEPWPDSQHPIIAEKTQNPEFTIGPDDSEETTLITDEPPLGPGFDLGPDDSEERTLIAAGQLQGPGLTLETEQSKENSIISEAQLFDLEEEEGQSETELQRSGCTIKPKCSTSGGHCVDNATLCYTGRLFPAGCKGSCECCIPECDEEKGFFRSPGSLQCFKFFPRTWLNWTASGEYCNASGMVLAHPYDAVSLRAYLVEKQGYVHAWLNARGIGSYFYWQDGTTYYPYIYNINSKWWSKPTNLSSSYCLTMVGYDYYIYKNATTPYHAYPCRYTRQVLCQVVRT